MIPRLHLITDDQVLAGPGFLSKAADAVAEGGHLVALHLRGPTRAGRALLELAERILPVAADHGTPLLVNDRVDVALASGAAGTQLGHRSLPAAEARAVLGADALIGASVHGPREALRAVEVAESEPSRPDGRRGADFLLAGTLFRTPSHPEVAAAGVERIREVLAVSSNVPVLGIGGISRERVPEVVAAGAHGVAVIRAVWAQRDVGRAVRGLLDELDDCLRPREG